MRTFRRVGTVCGLAADGSTEPDVTSSTAVAQSETKDKPLSSDTLTDLPFGSIEGRWRLEETRPFTPEGQLAGKLKLKLLLRSWLDDLMISFFFVKVKLQIYLVINIAAVFRR